MNQSWIYIITNTKRSTFYIGVTNNIERRMLEHKAGIGSKFASKYNLNILVYTERIPTISDAISREKQLKNWHREWKLNLIKEENPEMLDLASDWYTNEEIQEFLENQDYIKR